MTNENLPQTNYAKRVVQRLEALGTPSGTQRKHGHAESKANASPSAVNLQPIARVERRAIRFPHRIGGD